MADDPQLLENEKRRRAQYAEETRNMRVKLYESKKEEEAKKGTLVSPELAQNQQELVKFTQRMTEPQAGFDNFISAMSQIAALAKILHDAHSESESGAILSFAYDLIGPVRDKYFLHKLDQEIEELKKGPLPTYTKLVAFSDDNKLIVDSLTRADGIPVTDIEKLVIKNGVKSWLEKLHYKPASPNSDEYIKDNDPAQILTKAGFERLCEEHGLDDFLQENLGINYNPAPQFRP